MATYAALVPLVLSGCASFRTEAPPSARVDQPADCERVLREVDKPAIKDNDAYDPVLAEHRAALSIANATIKEGRECIAGQREAYGKR